MDPEALREPERYVIQSQDAELESRMPGNYSKLTSNSMSCLHDLGTFPRSEFLSLFCPCFVPSAFLGSTLDRIIQQSRPDNTTWDRNRRIRRVRVKAEDRTGVSHHIAASSHGELDAKGKSTSWYLMPVVLRSKSEPFYTCTSEKLKGRVPHEASRRHLRTSSTMYG